MSLHHTRQGTGPALLAVHGLGGTAATWAPIAAPLAAERELVAVDLPGFGASSPLPGETTIATLADALEAFLAEQDLRGVDVLGTSMGARLALELARRGAVGKVVALDPGGFWTPREQKVFGASIRASIALVRALQPVMPALTHNPVARTALFAQFSARPWALPGDAMLTEMRSYAAAPRFDEALTALASGPRQEGMPAGTARAPIVIGWGKHDKVTLPRQARVAQGRFPDARIHWFAHSGHFPFLDEPEETVRLVLRETG